jgi:hypothetical protein|tara:strand:- start:210 stop:314 length:105 start_codon:yes stop_codon:yes gene_type:complete
MREEIAQAGTKKVVVKLIEAVATEPIKEGRLEVP